jgi:hypothetical protein
VKPVDQEFVHNPEIGQFGDCQRAVVASLLELPLSDVPHFLQEAAGDSMGFWTRLQRFLASHGCLYIDLPAWDIDGYSDLYGTPAVYHEICGPSPRGAGLFHAVVGCNGKIVHDPHPSRAGLAGNPSEWRFGVYVRMNRGAA